MKNGTGNFHQEFPVETLYHYANIWWLPRAMLFMEKCILPAALVSGPPYLAETQSTNIYLLLPCLISYHLITRLEGNIEEPSHRKGHLELDQLPFSLIIFL